MDQSSKDLIINAFLVLHFIGIASLLAGFLTSLRELKTGIKLNAGVFHGAYLMLLSGLVMAGLADTSKLTSLAMIVLVVKIVILMLILFVAFTYRKKEVTPVWVVPSIAAMTILNITLAVFGGVSGS